MTAATPRFVSRDSNRVAPALGLPGRVAPGKLARAPARGTISGRGPTT